MKRTLIILGIILLVIVNISALTTIVHHRWFKDERRHPEPGPRHPLSFLRRELSLSDDQIALLEDRRASFDQQIGDVRDSLREKRRALMDELRAEAPDSLRIDQLVDEIGTLQAELEKLAIRHMVRTKEILTPQQQKEFLSMFEKHFHRRGLIPGPRGMRPDEPGWRPLESKEKKVKRK